MKCGETLFEVGARGHCVGLLMYDGAMKTVEYIWVNIWYMLDWVLLQNCRGTLVVNSFDQLVKSEKTEMLFYLTEPRTDTDWMDQYQTLNTWVYFRGLVSKFLGSPSQLCKVQTGGPENQTEQSVACG